MATTTYTSDAQPKYHPEYWVYLALGLVAIVLAFKGGHRMVAQYQASTGVVLTSDDIASVQDSRPEDLSNNQVTVHIVLTDAGAQKFATAKPALPIYFKGNEIGVTDTINEHTVTFRVPLLDAAKIKLLLKWRDNS